MDIIILVIFVLQRDTNVKYKIQKGAPVSLIQVRSRSCSSRVWIHATRPYCPGQHSSQDHRATKTQHYIKIAINKKDSYTEK